MVQFRSRSPVLQPDYLSRLTYKAKSKRGREISDVARSRLLHWTEMRRMQNELAEDLPEPTYPAGLETRVNFYFNTRFLSDFIPNFRQSPLMAGQLNYSLREPIDLEFCWNSKRSVQNVNNRTGTYATSLGLFRDSKEAGMLFTTPSIWKAADSHLKAIMIIFMLDASQTYPLCLKEIGAQIGVSHKSVKGFMGEAQVILFILLVIL